MPRKRSFFEKLTGAIKLDDDHDVIINEHNHHSLEEETPKQLSWQNEDVEGELTVDVYQTPTHVVIKTMIAGVRPEDIEVHIARDVVTIKGKREDEKEIKEDDYYHRELYWGSFSRTIILPQEVQADEAEAMERHGLLIVKIPKIDKHKQTRVKVRSN